MINNILLCLLIIFHSHIGFAADDNLFPTTTNSVDPGFTTTVVNVGQGNGITVRDNKNGHLMIVDCGSSAYPVGTRKKQIIPSFTTHIPQTSGFLPITIVVSHPDKDHLNFIADVIDYANGNKGITVYLGGNFEKYLTSDDAGALLKTLLKQQIIIHTLSHHLTVDEIKKLNQEFSSLSLDDVGYENKSSALIQMIRDENKLDKKVRPFIVKSLIDGFSDKSRVNVEILGANAGHTREIVYTLANSDQSFINDTSCCGGEVLNRDDNTNSIVLRVTFYNKCSMIITGDATGITTDRLIEHYPEKEEGLKCDLLIACHHGSITEESNNPRWVQITKPQWVVFSAGKHNGYHHPQFDAIWNYTYSERLKDEKYHPILCARVDSRQFPSEQNANARGISGIPPKNGNTKDQQWLCGIKCKKGIYSTHSSGTITWNVKSDGTMELMTEIKH